MQKIDKIPVNPNVIPEKPGNGSVPGLQDEELADTGELLRLTYKQFRGRVARLQKQTQQQVPFINTG